MTLKAYSAPEFSSANTPHGFFTRLGGVSGGIYQSLNCGPGSDDSKENVVENRRRAVKHLTGQNTPLATLYQIHSGKVVTTDKTFPLDKLPKADALVTRTPGLVVGVLTADCAPVLFADHQAGVVAAAHAGWRGALAGILENTLAAMEELGAKRKDISAAIGPCIGKACYEVGQDFYDPFVSADPAFGEFFAPGREGKYFFDLEGFASARLRHAGLENVTPLSIDTYQGQDEFFSFRRTTHNGEPDYGRQISAICLPLAD